MKSQQPNAFRTGPTGWRALQPAGSRKPPLLAPPISARQSQNDSFAEDLPPPQTPEQYPPAYPPHVGNFDWDDGSVIPSEQGFGGDDCEDCADGEALCSDCDAYCGTRFTLLNWIRPRSLELTAGVHGFKGPPDQGQNGNFGFHEGLNLAGPLLPHCGLAYQLGGQFIHSNLSGDQVVVQTSDVREQLFLTAGVYRRALRNCDWQGGVVFDRLHDDYYVNMTLSQVRGELSFVGPGGHELGMWFTAGTQDDNAITVNADPERWEVTDLFAFFYRKNLDCGVSCRAWLGFTGRSDALAGGEMLLPLSDAWATSANFNYLLPEGGSPGGASEESWALGINLVWYPCAASRCLPWRPLFNVADNATFMVNRRN